MINKHTFLIVILTFLLKLIAVKSTSYINNLTSLINCKNPVPPYLKDSPLKSTFDIYTREGKKIVRGNITVIDKAATKAFKWRLKGGILKYGQNRNLIDNNGFTCRYPFAYTVMSAAKLRFDRKSCAINTGFYKLDNIDVDKIDHAFSIIPFRSPGENIWEISIYNDKGTVMCIEVIGFITFLKP